MLVSRRHGFAFIHIEKNRIRRGCDTAERLQKDYVCDTEGNVMVSRIGRFETLDRDFREIADRLRLPVNLNRVNQSRRRAYHTYYSDLTRELVAARFAADIEAFGYRFEDNQAADELHPASVADLKQTRCPEFPSRCR